MGQYTTVTWQHGDEAVTSKLEQMCQNEEWLHDNLIAGNVNYMLGAQGQPPAGRSQGVVTANHIEAIRIDYDSLTAVSSITVKVQLPPVFTEAPVIAFAANAFGLIVGQLVTGDRTDYCEILIFQRDGITQRLTGTLNIICVGK
jgi:hypothetical protein